MPNITKHKIDSVFFHYCNDFYGPYGIYPLTHQTGHSLKVNDLARAIRIRLQNQHVETYYDSLDRENVRDILINEFGYIFPGEG